jgi:calcineurin-binding protein cabin-1
VELDTNDSVVWNHLGTLACKMGLLSISRWAFEQGLLCSPNNCMMSLSFHFCLDLICYFVVQLPHLKLVIPNFGFSLALDAFVGNCMEKLLEVLIAIRDEVACLSVANLLLRNWPSHHRALHVKKTIENPETVPFAPRGIDTLEPKHVRLDFSNKRKCAADEINQERKKCKHNATLQLSEAKWTALLDGIISLLTANSGLAYIPVDVVLSIDTSKPVEPAGGSGNELYHDGESLPSHDCKTTVKEKDVNSDREHPHERRSRRLERLRSRKSGKDEDESSGKDISHAITQFLDSFILKRVSTTDKKTDHSVNADTSNMETLTYTSDCEADDVKHFLLKICKNYGPCHIGYMLLEEIAHLNVPFQDYFVNIIELDKLTRVWSQGRSALCSLFLAELYHDRAICSGSSTTSLELSDSSYHLCKIIGSVALELPFSTAVEKMNSTSFDLDKENSSAEVNSSYKSDKNASDVSESSAKAKESNFSNMLCDETSEHDSSSDTERVNWVRFFWLSGCVSLSTDCKERAYKEFNIALSLLTNGNKAKSSTEFILLPHTKFVKFLTADRILREINLIKLDSLLWKNDENIKNITHTEFKELLPPLLLSTNDVYVGSAYGSLSESERVISLELSALDVLISACEKAQPMDVKIYLDSHRRKIHILTVAAGMVGAFGTPKGNISSDADFVKAMNRNWLENVMEAVKEVSRSVSIAKDIIDQSDTSVSGLFICLWISLSVIF